MKNGKAVVVTTEHRGVFFGYLESQDGKTLVLKSARCCVYWTSETKGFVGLATTGPKAGSRVGPAVSRLELFGVTSIVDASDDAVKQWESEPW